MAPPASTATETVSLHTLSLRSEPAIKTVDAVKKKDARLRWWSETARDGDVYPYEHFLPFFDTELRLPPLEPFKHVDPGHKALSDPSPRSFLQGAEVDDLTPDFGSEVSGVQLHQLDERGRQQLALFVAQRGVVVSEAVRCCTQCCRGFALPSFDKRRSLRDVHSCRPSATKTLQTRTRRG